MPFSNSQSQDHRPCLEDDYEHGRCNKTYWGPKGYVLSWFSFTLLSIFLHLLVHFYWLSGLKITCQPEVIAPSEPSVIPCNVPEMPLVTF